MDQDYKKHRYRYEVDTLNQLRLWVDEKEIRAAKSTHFEPLPAGTDAFTAEEYAHHAAKKIIDHLGKEKITVDQAYDY
jgi:hypothetical protein